MEKISYKIKRSSRARNMRISIGVDSGVVVTAPYFASAEMVENFVRSNIGWIRKKTQDFLKYKDCVYIKTSKADYLQNKEIARKMIREKIDLFNQKYKFKYNRISIKNQKTLWGSCSSGGNLNFNYALVKLPQEMVDYVVVHEMCHLWNFDHSAEFWKRVGSCVPDYKRIRREMKKIIFV